MRVFYCIWCFVLRYGVYLGLLQDNSGTMNDLHMVLSTVKMQLKGQQYSNKPTLGKLPYSAIILSKNLLSIV